MTLQEFYVTHKEAIGELHEFLDAILVDEAVKKVFAREDTSGVAEAKEILNKAFQELDQQLGAKEEPARVMNNPAR